MAAVFYKGLLWWCICMLLVAVALAQSEHQSESKSDSETDAGAATAEEEADTSAKSASFRLPGNVYPTHYDLTLAYDLDPLHDFPFFGLAVITIYAKKSTNNITLHAKGFTVAEDLIEVVGGDGSVALVVSAVRHDSSRDLLSLRVSRPLESRARYELRVPFRGRARAELDGVYVSSYTDERTQEKQYLLASQFEAIAARKAFPCFDEPNYKATFTLTIGHHNNFTAISNMPLNRTLTHNPMENVWSWDTMNEEFKVGADSWEWSQFGETPRMSTYLVALVLGRLAQCQSERGHVTFSTWARPSAITQAKYASEIGPKVLSYFEEFFNVSYPLPKMDQVALPDFAAGAMENWGLVTYRETALLVATDAALGDRARVAGVVAHELAHQWFGNLVTMEWWSELWLNEGFATYMSTYGVSAVQPTWRVNELDASETVRAVWRLDALRTSHPVAVPLDDPRRIAEIFDAISYSKGSVLVRMMMQLLGERVFRAGLHNYLVKYSYGNANQESLWEELTRAQEEAGGPSSPGMRDVMHSWSTQPGYPLINATRDYRDNSLSLTQRRYLSGGGGGGASKDGCHDDEDATWWVPLGLLTESQARAEQCNDTAHGDDDAARHNDDAARHNDGAARHNDGAARHNDGTESCNDGAGCRDDDAARWLAAGEGRPSAPHRVQHDASCSEWLLLNADLVGPYRVNYDTRNWELLARALASPSRELIPAVSRAQLLADCMELAASGILPYASALQIVNYLRDETDYIPLAAGFEALGRLKHLLQRTPQFGSFARFVRMLVSRSYSRSGGLDAIAQHTDLLTERTQVLAASYACHAELPECVSRAEALFEEWRAEPDPDNNSPVIAALRGTVVCAGVKQGGAAAWRWSLERAQRAKRPAERARLRTALACSPEPWILTQYLEWCVSNSSMIRRQDAGSVMAAVAAAPVGHYVARDFLYERVADIADALKGRTLGLVVRSIVTGFIKQRELDEFLKWREEHNSLLEDAKMTIDQAVEVATNNIQWSLKQKDTLVEEMRRLSE